MAYVGYLSRKSSQEIDKFPKKVKLWLPVRQKSVLNVVCNENEGGVVEKMAYVGYLSRKSSQVSQKSKIMDSCTTKKCFIARSL
jgi:hypothetical protein